MSWATLPFACFFLAGCLHAVLRRMIPAFNTVTVFVGIGAASGAALLVTLLSTGRLRPIEVMAGACLYAFLCELYIFSFTFAFGSVSAAVLLAHLGDRAAERNGAAALQEIMIQRRIAGMCASGLLRQRSGTYEITGKGRLVARADRILGGFFNHERTARSGARAA